MSKLSDYEKQKAALTRRIEKQREKQNSPEYKAKQLQKQREAAQRQQQKQRDKLADPEYRQAQLAKAKLQQKPIKPKTPKPVDIEAQRAKQLAAAQRQQQRQREKQLAQWQDPTQRAEQRKKALAKPAIKNRGLKGRAKTAEEKRLEALLARIGCICCKNKGWYTEAMNSQEGQHFISMHHVDGRTKPWSHAKQLPLCQYHHDTPPPQNAPEHLFPLHGTGRKLWEKVNGTQTELLEQVYRLVGESPPWLQED